jgi:hypothetical protein
MRIEAFLLVIKIIKHIIVLGFFRKCYRLELMNTVLN